MRTAPHQILIHSANIATENKCLAVVKLFFLVGIVCFLVVSSASAEEQYNGTYHGRRVISKSLADFCQIADDVIVSDTAAVKECLNKLAAKLHDSDAKIQEEGKKEFQQIQLDQWVYTVAQGANKNSNVANYTDDYATMTQAVNSPGGDGQFDETGIAAATEKQMTALLDLTSMYSELLKAQALADVSQMDAGLPPVLPANGDTENINFSGMYENIQIVPNALAIYCQLNGDTFIMPEQQEKVERCLATLIAKMNANSDAERGENSDIYTAINTEQIQNMFIKAIERSAGDVDYAKARQDQDKANGETQTAFETTASMSAASNLQQSAINDFLYLYSMGAKYQALKNLKNVDAKAIANELKEATGEQKISDTEITASTETTSVTVSGGEEEEMVLDEKTGGTQSSEQKYDADTPTNSNEPIDERLLDNLAEMGGIKN